MMSRALVVALLLLARSAWAQAPVSLPVQEHRLANGLRVVLAPDPTLGDVSIVVRYGVGSADDPAGLEGLAHLVEHLMFARPRHVPVGDTVIRLLERAGATNVQGTTALDATTYRETLPPGQLELALWLESDRMAYLLEQLDERALTAARASVLNEYRDRITDAALGEENTIAMHSLFPSWHPYRRSGIGTPETIGAVTLAQARAFLGSWYSAGNSTLFIAGRFLPEQAMGWVQRYFGTLPGREVPTRPRVPEHQPRAEQLVHVAASLSRDSVRVSWVTPALGAPDDALLDVIAQVLAGSDAGVLQRRLVLGQHVAEAAYASQRSLRLASIFDIHLTVAKGQKPKAVLAALDGILAELERDLGNEDAEAARLALRRRRIFALESSMARALQLAARRASGPIPAGYDWELGPTTAPEALRGVVARHLPRTRRVITVVHGVAGRPTHGIVVDPEEIQW